jgi:hypothetical protein
MDTKAYSSHSAPKRRYPDLAADEFFVSDKYHDDWRVSPYVTKDGLPAFGPHSHDKLTGNAQEIPPPLPDPAQAYLACKDYGEKEKVIETLSQTPEGRLYLEGRLRDEEDPRAFMTIFETLFSADQALRRGRPHLERYVYTRAAFCGRLAMESVTPDQAFCSDRGYYFEFGPCVCYDGLEADGGWENTAESDMNYSVQSRPELTSAPSPFFSACSKYDCEFKIESCTERGCTYIHCVPNPTTEDVSCTIGGEYSEQLTSPSARISSG